jgi:hypothetical protein
MRTVVAAGLAAVFSLVAARAQARVRVAVGDLQIAGGDSTALSGQLQEGFALGLASSGVQVIDLAETTKRLEGHPELQRCDTSPCLKAVGALLDVRYVAFVHVELAGKSYKSVARVFSTQGSAPAALPIATQQKNCDVCTVVEARESMLRLADMLRPKIEEPLAAAPTLPPAAPPRSPSVALPIVAAMVGVVTVAVGFAVLGSNASCTGSACSENRTRSAVGGGLIGAGAVAAVAGTYVTIIRSRGADPVTGVAVAFRF